MTSGERVEKFHNDDLWVPMQILSRKCFWFTAGWTKFPSWYDQFWKGYIILVHTCLGHDMLSMLSLTSFCGKPMVISWNITCFPRAKLITPFRITSLIQQISLHAQVIKDANHKRSSYLFLYNLSENYNMTCTDFTSAISCHFIRLT